MYVSIEVEKQLLFVMNPDTLAYTCPLQNAIFARVSQNVY